MGHATRLAATIIAMVTAAVAPANAAEEYPLYVVINEHSKMCLDVAYGSVDNGARIQQYYCYGGAPTKWRYKPLGNNVFQIINENSKKCLDLPYGNPNTPRGTTLQQWTCWDGVMQKWQIRQDGTNRQWISSVANPSLCLDVKDWNVDPGGTVQVWDCWDANVQKWRHFRQ